MQSSFPCSRLFLLNVYRCVVYMPVPMRCCSVKSDAERDGKMEKYPRVILSPRAPMPAYCDVALPVPLDRAFTYSIEQATPAVGARVLVPFRNEKLAGVVLRVHDDPPQVETKQVLNILDEESILSPQLLELAQWIAMYYIAPIGEVLRAMLPLMSEVRKQVLFRITETGREALFRGAQEGSSRRTRRTPEEQDTEYKVLNYLENGDAARMGTLRSATGATRELLTGMLRKKWIGRETAAAPRDARRMVRYSVLVEGTRLPKLNENQQAILAELAGSGNELQVAELRRRPVPHSTLATLVKRNLVRIEERPAEFHLTHLAKLPRP